MSIAVLVLKPVCTTNNFLDVRVEQDRVVESTERLSQGISALRSGNKLEAEKILRTVVQEDAQNPDAWLWLAASVSTPGETLNCLERAIALDPGNKRAKAGIEWAQAQLKQERYGEDALLISPPLAPETLPQLETAPSAPVVSQFFPNLIIAILTITLLLGVLMILVLLEAWIG